MSEPRFEWDSKKESRNRAKHGVSFSEAATVFSDDSALFMEDSEHSETEPRFLLLGMSSSLKLLVVVHAYREHDDVIRIISARRATKRERSDYIQRWAR